MKAKCATSTCTIPVEFLFGSKVASLTCKRRSPISRWLCERPTCANQNEHCNDQQLPNESKSSTEPSKYAVGTNETIMKPYGSITLRGTNMRRGERKPASHLPLFSPKDFSPTDLSPIYFSPTDFSPRVFHPYTSHPYTFHPETLHPETLLAQTFHPETFHPRVFHPHTFHPQTFTHIFSPTYFSPTYLGLYTFHPETLLPQAFQTFHPETLDQYMFFLPSDFFTHILFTQGLSPIRRPAGVSDCEVLFLFLFLFCTCFCSWLALVPLFSSRAFLLRLNQSHPPPPPYYYYYYYYYYY